jgi:hypothetical protein
MVAVVTGVNGWATDVETGAESDVEVGGTNGGTVVEGAWGTSDVEIGAVSGVVVGGTIDVGTWETDVGEVTMFETVDLGWLVVTGFAATLVNDGVENIGFVVLVVTKKLNAPAFKGICGTDVERVSELVVKALSTVPSISMGSPHAVP